MIREEMMKTRWRPYMEIDYKHSRMEHPIRCLLLAIEFDEEILTLQPLEDLYLKTDFTTSLGNCFIPKRLKAAYVNGKKVKEVIGEIDYLKSKNDWGMF